MFKMNHAKKNCLLCGSDQFKTIYQGCMADIPTTDKYTITEASIKKPEHLLRCQQCGLTFVPQTSNQHNLEAHYIDMVDEQYLDEEISRRETSQKVLKRIQKFKKTGRLLEVGCATGFFLDEAKKNGWDVCGIEPSKWAADYAAQTFNLKVTQSLLNNTEETNNSFDVIVMLDVIEHLTNPARELQALRQMLKNDGILYISTPNISSFTSKLLKSRWWGINQYHLFCFSKKTLSKLLKRVHIKPKKYYSHPRSFSVNYLLKRSGLPKPIIKIFSSLTKWCHIDSLRLPINFHDQIDVIVRKSITLDDIIATEAIIKKEKREDMKTFVVMPAYNAEKTLERTLADVPRDVVNEIILVDDCSTDNTVETAKKLGIQVIVHKKNTGYGGNQKTCYKAALEQGADIVVMVHPDYQYDPTIIPKLLAPIKNGEADAVFGSRMMKGGALEGGMPIWKHNANILLTALENVVLNSYLTEYHSGFRAYSADLLRAINFEKNSDNFVFDTEIIVQAILKNFTIEETPIKTRYFDEASKIRLLPCINYGLGILWTLLKYKLHSKNLITFKQFE